MKILICGDSFASDWTVKYPDRTGWPNLLAQHHDVVNLAQAGCGEYKILLQLLSVDLDQFDQIIVSHTSPYRIYVKTHPVHAGDVLHDQSDLIYADIKEHSKTDKKLSGLIDYFENYVDLSYLEFIHSLIIKEIKTLLKGQNVLHLSHQDILDLDPCINFSQVFRKHAGLMNHYDDQGNFIVYSQIAGFV
jgi:hypothetical protein